MFLFVGYEYHLDSALVKPTRLKLQALILRLKSKHLLTAKCLMSLIALLASTEKVVPEGHRHMRPFQFHLKEHWRYPQSLDNLLPWSDYFSSPRVVAKFRKYEEGRRPSLQRPQYPNQNEGWGAHLEQVSTKGLWSDWEKRLHINVIELKAVSLAMKGSGTSAKTKQYWLLRTTQQ